MDLGVGAGELVLLVGALLAAGFLTGLLAGLLGIGGGGILVPVLYDVFGALGIADAVRMHLAVGTSLAVIVPTSLRSFKGHRARGAVDMALLKSMALPVVAGVALGARRCGSARPRSWR
ncbi:MAG: family transporter [Geminicoccaceae bacterium]|nr:family transporter [Geminicoccaceae bacterium]